MAGCENEEFFSFLAKNSPFFFVFSFFHFLLKDNRRAVLPLPFVLKPRFQASQRKFWRELSGFFFGCGCYAKKQTCFCLFAHFHHEGMQVTVFFMSKFDCRKVIEFTCSSKYWSLFMLSNLTVSYFLLLLLIQGTFCLDDTIKLCYLIYFNASYWLIFSFLHYLLSCILKHKGIVSCCFFYFLHTYMIYEWFWCHLSGS